jgi:hypothetical protein
MLLQDIETRLSLRRMKMLSKLQKIYPITKGKTAYMIRDLELPHPIKVISDEEESLSAALGYVSHLSLMISKYYSVLCHVILVDIGPRYLFVFVLCSKCLVRTFLMKSLVLIPDIPCT